MPPPNDTLKEIKQAKSLTTKQVRGINTKKQSLLRFKLFRKIEKFLSLNLRNILISPLEGEKKFLGELCELRNFREGYNLKYSCPVQHETVLEPSPAFVMLTEVRKRLLPLTKREGCDSVISSDFKSKISITNENNLSCKDLSYFGRSALLCRQGRDLSALVPQYLSNFSDTVLSRFTSHFSLKRTAFTLAEVLITLGIIGIVASLTLPNIIYNYQKHVVETRLQKFYSTINQAVRLTEQDYGDRENWAQQGNQNEIEFINKYYVPYLNVTKTRKIAWNKPYVLYFEDGSALGHSGWGRDWLFFPGDPEKCLKQEKYIGRCAFSFYFNPIPGLYRENNFEPFSFAMTNNDDFIRNDSVRGCNNNGGSGSYCTKLIQRNGWKIPKDYPYRIRF